MRVFIIGYDTFSTSVSLEHETLEQQKNAVTLWRYHMS